MKISLNWLKELLPIDVQNPQDLDHDLTQLGIEVESVTTTRAAFKGVVVGKVLSKEKHPNADRLSVCKVDVGTGEALQIVCGAANVAEGQFVPVAIVGATLPTKDGQPFVIKKSAIRKVESQGMICAEDELGLSDNHDGILVLDETYQIGKDFATYIEADTILEIAMTPNRPDVLSHLGIARELAALKKLSVKRPTLATEKPKAASARVVIEDADACPRYSAKIIEGVTVKPSPEWLQKRLKAVGLRPINNIADITNYVLYELGHPLHAFDLDKLSGHGVTIRSDYEGDFVTLDHKVRKIEKGMLVICDQSRKKRPACVAGVMGGLDSEISNETKNILLESAVFKPQSVRKTAKKLGLSSDASYRFERGCDADATLAALDRAEKLILELAGGTVTETSDTVATPFVPKEISFRPERANAVIGLSLNAKAYDDIFAGLGIAKKSDKTYTQPSWRIDLLEEIDLIEEAVRLFGYDNVPLSANMMSTYPTIRDKKAGFEDFIRREMIGLGFREILTNSMMPLPQAEMFSKKIVQTLNPISEDMQALRPSLVPSLLKVVAHNLNRGNKNQRLFEVANVFEKDAEWFTFVKPYAERTMLGVALVGQRTPRSWSLKEQATDFYDLKGTLEMLFRKISLENVKFIYYSQSDSYTTEVLNIEIENTLAGSVFAVSPDTLKKFDIDEVVFMAELDLAVLKRLARFERDYKEPAKFPEVYRDLAFVTSKEVLASDMVSEMLASDKTIRDVTIFDVFEGKQNLDASRLGEGQNGQSPAALRSIAFSLRLVSYEKTLTDEEIARILEKATAAIKGKFGAVLREA
jgi:phenylalanyl-tRNA synthetase beta chain